MAGLLVAVAGLSRSLAGRIAMRIYVDFFRAIPPLVLLIFIYSALPFAGINLSPLAAVVIAFTLNTSSFYGEIFRAGIESVGQGQWHAARASGLTATQALIYIILPQAIRITIPPLTNRTIAIVKNTALGTVIGVPEILNQATTAVSFAGNATPLTLGALAYLVLFLPVVMLGRWIETRFAWKRA